jgi:hypothetical protein
MAIYKNKLWTRHYLGFIVEIKKQYVVKKKRTLAFDTLHKEVMFIHFLYDKKGSFYRRLLIAARQMVH